VKYIHKIPRFFSTGNCLRFPGRLGQCRKNIIGQVWNNKCISLINNTPKRMTKKTGKKRTWLYILGGFVILLIAFRLYLPTLLLNYINKTLQEIEDYTGHVDDIDISLYRGAYQIRGIKLEKKTGKVPVPFIDISVLDLSVQWKALFDGAVVGEIRVIEPEINFVKGPSEEESQTEMDSSWVDVVDKWMPLKINKLEIRNGEIHYRDFHSKPKVDIMMRNIQGIALNLSNSKKSSDLLPSTVEASAEAYDGTFSLKMKLNALAKVPTFDLNAELRELNLVKLNSFLRAYANVDVKKGLFGLYAEVAAKDNSYEGYVKPILKDMDILQLDKEEGSVLQVAWEAAVGAVNEVLKNQKKDQTATKVPFTGRFDQSNVDIWTAVGGILKNAFISAFKPSIDNSVNIAQVDGQQDKSKKDLRKERREKRKEERKGKKEE
jgi:hypothetical protein